VFGPHDRDFLRLFQMALKGVVIYPGVETHWLSLLHVDDVVDGLLAAGRPSVPASCWFLASADAVQWKTLGDEIGKAVGRRVWHLNLPGALVRGAARVGDLVALGMLETPLLNGNKAALSKHAYWLCTAERAKRELGWQPRRSLPDGLRDTYLWYEQRGWLRGARRAAATVA
jgi:nucleoside-diphosphate-sugar epimerase